MRKSGTCGEVVTQTCELASVHFTIIAVGNAVRCLYAPPTASLRGAATIARSVNQCISLAAQKPYTNKEETILEVRTIFGFAIWCIYQNRVVWLLNLV